MSAIASKSLLHFVARTGLSCLFAIFAWVGWLYFSLSPCEIRREVIPNSTSQAPHRIGPDVITHIEMRLCGFTTLRSDYEFSDAFDHDWSVLLHDESSFVVSPKEHDRSYLLKFEGDLGHSSPVDLAQFMMTNKATASIEPKQVGTITGIVFSPDKRWLVVASQGDDRRHRYLLWDLQTSTLVHRAISPDIGHVDHCDHGFDPSGRYYLSLFDHKAMLWDLSTTPPTDLTSIMHYTPGDHVWLTPAKKMVLLGWPNSYPGCKIIDLQTKSVRELPETLYEGQGGHRFAVAPSGRFAMTERLSEMSTFQSWVNSALKTVSLPPAYSNFENLVLDQDGNVVNQFPHQGMLQFDPDGLTFWTVSSESGSDGTEHIFRRYPLARDLTPWWLLMLTSFTAVGVLADGGRCLFRRNVK